MSDVSRRAVLGAGAATVGLAVAGSITAPAGAATAGASALERTHFARAVGRQFLARHGRVTHRVTLKAVHDLQPSTKAQRLHCFALIFVRPDGKALPAGIYQLARDGHPTAELFLSPIGDSAEVQAVVNRAH